MLMTNLSMCSAHYCASSPVIVAVLAWKQSLINGSSPRYGSSPGLIVAV